MKRQLPNPVRRLRRGATSVEFALVFPVFLTVNFFFFEAWRFQQFQETVDQAALETARAAVVPGATVADARDRGSNLLQAVGAESAELTISPDPITEDTDQVTVTVTVKYRDVGLFFQYFASDYVFTSTLTLNTENSRIKRI